MVSFILLTSNGNKYLIKAINSIYKSKIEDEFEIIVVDDASYEKVNLEGIKVIRNNMRLGAAASRNIGIKNSKGEIICFIDDDVWLEENCINILLKEIKKYDIVYTVPYREDNVPIFPIFATKNYPVISAIFMIKRKTINKLDLLFDDEYQIYNEDIDFFLQCKLFGINSKYVSEAKAFHWNKELSNPEFRYYMELRNSIYGWLKFHNIKCDLVGFGTLKLVVKNIINLLRNKNAYAFIYRKNRKEKKILNFYHKILPIAKITNKTHIYILYLIIKAFIWNLSKLSKIREKNLNIKRKIKKL